MPGDALLGQHSVNPCLPRAICASPPTEEPAGQRVVRRECLDRLLVFHRAQLETVLSEFFDHYNELAPFAAEKKPLRIGDPDPVQLRRRDKLGGLVHEYRLVA